jgi:hypothetical protein
MNAELNLHKTVLLIALASIYPLQANADAGVAHFTFGDVTVRRSGGVSTPLAKGASVNSGDDIVTGKGSQAHIKFTDGGMVSLQGGTQFKITRYADQSDSKSDSFFVELARGGMRAITGLIGKRNKDNYKVTTNTATIGIRGSSFFLSYNEDGSLSATAEQDSIVVCTNAGCTALTAGESVKVTGKDASPSRTNERAKSEESAPPPNADPKIVGNQPSQFRDLLGAAADSSSTGYTVGAVTPQPSVEFQGGQVVKFITNDASNTVLTKTGSGSFGTVSNLVDADFIGWGYWSAGTKTDSINASTALSDFHYIVARPTASDRMPMQGTATYSLIGGTAPTATDSYTGISQVGQLISATMSIDFSQHIITSGTIQTQFGATAVPIDISSGGMAYNQNGARFSCTNTATITGVFSGNMASRAGLTYSKTGTAVGDVRGAVVMGQTSAAGLSTAPAPVTPPL